MNIFESIAAVQADVDFIGKDKQVQSGGSYRYRGVDQVLNTLHPLFAKYKVFATPEVLDVLFREIRKTAKGGEVVYQALKVRYTFYAEDGTSVSATVVGEAMDSGDKSSNKCMSVAYKYACFQILSIPTEETSADPDDDNQDLAPKQNGGVSAKNPLTRKEIESYGVTDVNKTAEWIRKKYGKAVTALTDDETEEIRMLLKEKQEARSERARQYAEADGEASF